MAEIKSISIHHVDEYPIILCKNKKCEKAFCLIDIGNIEQYKKPDKVNMMKKKLEIPFCPFCGASQNILNIKK